jgi:serine/threonine protein kinase/Flp pilus assembly protein TadD
MKPSLDEVSDSATDVSFAVLLEEIASKCLAGEPVDWSAHERDHPEYVEELRQLVPAMEAVADLSRSARGGDAAPPGGEDALAGTLGDFRIFQEIGRGGMGVVYEAEQISLCRRVALKVLPFASTLDARQLQRFKNEAQAAAGLHHTNIVPVFATGCERGVHYYAMQYIEGQSLAQVIAELYGIETPTVKSEQKASAKCAGDRTVAGISAAQAGIQTPPDARLSTLASTHGRAFFHAIARLGIQAAEALDYAHDLGVIHRDIKPANILVDARGKLWITDFGLAHCQSQAGLTMSGDLVGTLRYMSTEQALAKRVLVDHRTDIYSLGATLYELLTGKPVFTGHDRQELLRQIAFEEPKQLRRINKAIPTELDTIVLKSLEKNPADRYATAKEMSEDLERFVNDEPIRARRPSPIRRARNWGRKHRTLVWSAGVALFVAATVLAGAIGWIARDQATRQALIEQAVQKDWDEADIWQDQKRWTNVLQTMDRATARFNAGELPELQAKVEERRRDAAMIVRLEKAVASGVSDGAPGQRDVPGIDKTYRQAFVAYGLEVEMLPLAETVHRIRASAIRDHLVKALDNWAFYLGHWGGNNKKWAKSAEALRSVARLADNDEWRKQMRDPHIIEDREALIRLAASDAVLAQPPEHIMILFHFLESLTHGVKSGMPSPAVPLGSKDPGVRMLLRVQKLYPADFWINLNLGYHLRAEPKLAAEAVGYCRVAVSLEPHNWGPYVTLGEALWEQKRQDEANESFLEAIKLQTSAVGCLKFAQHLLARKMERHMPEVVESAILRAMKLKPRYADAYVAKGRLLQTQGKSRDAETAFRQAIELDPKDGESHFALAKILRDQSDLSAAEAVYRKCIELFPGSRAHYQLGHVLLRQGRFVDAEGAYRKAIHYQPGLPWAHSSLGVSLVMQDKVAESEPHFRKAVEIARNDAAGHHNLGKVLSILGRFADAVESLRKGIELSPNYAEAHHDLAKALRGLGRSAEADREAVAAFELAKTMVKAVPQCDWDDACLAAACAGIGDTNNLLDADESAAIRGQALKWLQSHVAARRERLKKEAGKPLPDLAGEIRYWLKESDFYGVRGEAALAKLPEAEAQEWRKLWEDVAELARQPKAVEQR